MGTVNSYVGPYKFATRERTPTNEDNMIYYSEDYPAEQLVSADGQYQFTFVDVPVGAEVVRLDIETKTMSKAYYGWNGTSRILTLYSYTNDDPLYPGDRVTGYPTSTGQLISIIYKIKKTTL